MAKKKPDVKQEIPALEAEQPAGPMETPPEADPARPAHAYTCWVRVNAG